MFNQTFRSPQVKQSVIICNTHGADHRVDSQIVERLKADDLRNLRNFRKISRFLKVIA